MGRSKAALSNFDFSKIDVQDFLEELSVRNVHRKGREVAYSCPFDGHTHADASSSATMSTVAVPDGKGGEYPPTTFYCFGCGKSGNAISFLSEYEGISPLKARRFLRERFGMTFRPVDGLLIDEIEEALSPGEVYISSVNPSLSDDELESRYINWSDVFEAWDCQDPSVPPALSYMLDRGFWPDTLQRFCVGFDSISQRISIPVFDDRNNLIGFKGRGWHDDQIPKYLVLGGEDYGFQPYEVARVLFALEEVCQSIGPDDEIIVTEGELNAMSMHQKGFPFTVGFSGRYLSDYQIALISKYANRALIIHDDIEDSIRAATKLGKHMKVRVAQRHDEDPALMNVEDLADLVASAPSSLLLR